MISNARNAGPIYQQLTDNLKQQIRSGVLRPGDRLQSVRELASSLAINPNTIQRAYRELETEGWILSIPGKGSYVCATEKEGSKEMALFRDTVRTLLSQGVSGDELIRVIHEIGGKQNA
ncbi:MAG: GntR family transcriptional regulator [Faecousia sp.]